jgi:hypothetical protein
MQYLKARYMVEGMLDCARALVCKSTWGFASLVDGLNLFQGVLLLSDPIQLPAED